MGEAHSDCFKWAIVGTGSVARQFAYGLTTVPKAGRVALLVAREPEKTKRVAKDIGAPAWTVDYAKCLQSDVDGVYIAAPLASHEELAIAALRAGKATLLEKPFALDGQSARRIMAVAKETGTFCMEAVWPRFLPIYQELKAKIDAGDLGDLRQFGATFSGAVEMDGKFGVFDGSQRGGALMHRACYGVSLARYLLGPITEVKAVGHVLGTGVDAHVNLLLSHTGGATSSIGASYASQNQDQVFVAGAKATVELSPSIYRPTRARIRSIYFGKSNRAPSGREALKASVTWNWVRDQLDGLRRFKSRGCRLNADLRGFGYGYQAAEVVSCVAAGLSGSPYMTLNESVEIADVLDAAYIQIHKGIGV